MDTYSLLDALTSPVGIAGDESDAAKAAAALLEPLGEISTTPLGGVICRFGVRGKPRVMLTAHLDEIGLMVTRIEPDGFLRVAACGGVDRRSLWGARVTVHTADGPLPGVIASTPPHLMGEDSGAPVKVDQIGVDIGLPYEKAKKLVAPGDRVSFTGPLMRLQNGRVSGRALDDRAGCAAVLLAAGALRDTDRFEIVVALAPMEETGSGGSGACAFSVKPDYAFAVDVSMASTPDDKPEDCGEFGAGPMIGFSPILNRALSKGLVQYAEQNGIPYQREIMASRTGTDADHIAPSGEGVRTALLSIPLRYMHTPAEVVELCDIENTAKLIADFIREVL